MIIQSILQILYFYIKFWSIIFLLYSQFWIIFNEQVYFIFILFLIIIIYIV